LVDFFFGVKLLCEYVERCLRVFGEEMTKKIQMTEASNCVPLNRY